MNPRLSTRICKSVALCGLLLLFDRPPRMMAEPAPSALSAFNSYIDTLELRLAQQHRSAGNFIAVPSPDPKKAKERLLQRELVIERLTPSIGAEPPGSMLHHWRGTAFASGAHASEFEYLLRDFNSYPRTFAPQIIQARVLTQDGDRMSASMRVRQKHIIPVVMDTTYEVAFGQLDREHRYSVSRSTRIAEIASPGTASERALSSREEHGFLWRLNTYWSYEERDGGLYIQIESVSLTRAIPAGLGWAVRPYVESVPREALDFTLRATCNALRK